ncbi:hypothetical protein M409DRAFT_20035 [Zasmidium cellare ATCC 36951]|uniref:Heterokaryon incompatibility domain-containing protein n=1 Tax=Zasmidium cellare ATCC 36951 TaxID=1080233 RepID=A0A6A6CRB2_ZASCE|nr:uncharacterized protein M409DRAFT_20035 [Zasmidium cellare ATCC 36951]KAF2169621.1 hypothetical protein M409DRAFT_20035 [Zasmidium cellare ATCC 36951]
MAVSRDATAVVTATARRLTPATYCEGCHEVAYLQLTVPSNFARVTRITVNVTSHDQGFSSHENPVCGSFFHVAIVAPEGHFRQRWHAFQNRIANPKPFTQTRTWPGDALEKFAVRTIRVNDTIQILPQTHFVAWRNNVLKANIEIFGEVSASSRGPVSPLESYANYMPQALYAPLKEKEIRVLRLLDGEPGSTIGCTLEHMQLVSVEHLQFEALSYCWGDALDLRTIEVSGRPFQVTANLHRALLRLRSSTKMFPRVLWIDAICINQSDEQERSVQVEMMKEIYSAASQVIVWLSDLMLSPDDMSNMREIFDVNNDESSSGYPEPSLDKMSPLDRETLWKGLPQVYGQASSALFKNEWFNRVWVLQEVFNAKKAIVFCGDRALSWTSVLQADEGVHRSQSSMHDYQTMMSTLFSDVFELTMSDNASAPKRFGYRRKPPTADVLDIVIAGLELDATDPRDKLYALLSLIPSSSNTALRPDYTKAVGDVLREFTRWWISSRRSLRIFSAIHCSVGRTWQKLSPLPPSSSSSERSSWSLWYDGKSIWGQATLGLSPTTTYRASRETIPDETLLSQTNNASKSIFLRGFTIDILDSIVPFPYYSAIQPTSPHATLRRPYERLFDPVGHVAVFHTGSPSRVHGIGTYLDAPETEMPGLVDHLRTHEGYAQITGGAIKCHPPCFFTTTTGIKGLCPHTAREGDLVAVLNGGKVPYLLRRCEDDGPGDGSSSPEIAQRQPFQLVGECYLQGYMDGEAMDDPKAGTEIFELI